MDAKDRVLFIGTWVAFHVPVWVAWIIVPDWGWAGLGWAGLGGAPCSGRWGWARDPALVLGGPGDGRFPSQDQEGTRSGTRLVVPPVGTEARGSAGLGEAGHLWC